MRILIIEDERKIAQAMKEGLVQQSYAVDICYEGETGLNFALDEPYDLIILDRMLPGNIDGITFCQKLRTAQNHTPVLMLTAKAHAEDRVTGLDSGADDYLAKPFFFPELLARIRALLRRPHDTAQNILTVGDLSLNTVTKEVHRADTPIHLSAKEYALLEYLLRNKEKVLSKNTLMNHVWDFDADILPSTVEVFIVYLRAKIDKPFPGPPLIRTVRGFGYKIAES